MIYLCKSNRCDPTLVSAIRRSIPKELLLEHSGGTYNPSLIKKADKVIVVPSEECDEDTECFIVGKGQLQEIKDNIAICEVVLTHDYVIEGYSRIRDIHVFNFDSWTETAYIYINDNQHLEKTAKYDISTESKNNINEEELLL